MLITIKDLSKSHRHPLSQFGKWLLPNCLSIDCIQLIDAMDGLTSPVGELKGYAIVPVGGSSRSSDFMVSCQLV